MYRLITACFLLSFPASQAYSQSDEKASVGSVLSELQQQSSGPQEHVLLARGQDGVPHNRVIVHSDRIDVLDDEGKVTRSIAREDDLSKKIYTHFILSDSQADSKALGVHIERGYSQAHEGPASGEYFIINKDGQETLHIKKFDDTTEPVPSPSGDYAVGSPEADTPGGPPIFYDSTGVRNAKWAHGYTGEGWPENYGVDSVHFSPAGDRVAIFASPGFSGINPTLILYDAQGNNLWDRKSSGEVAFSPDGLHLAVASAESVALLSLASGESAWQTNIGGRGVAHLRFSADGKQLCVATTSGGIFLLKAVDGVVAWHWDVRQMSGLKGVDREDQFSLTGLDTADDMSAIALVGTVWRYKAIGAEKSHTRKPEGINTWLSVLSGTGKLLGEKLLPPNILLSAGASSTGVGISKDGRTLILPTKTGTRKFEINR